VDEIALLEPRRRVAIRCCGRDSPPNDAGHGDDDRRRMHVAGACSGAAVHWVGAYVGIGRGRRAGVRTCVEPVPKVLDRSERATRRQKNAVMVA
jgi:hypothetical protein